MSDTQKKADLPAGLIPKGGIHTGDGWCFRRNPDGTATVMVISPLNGSRIETTLSVAELTDVVKLLVFVKNEAPQVEPASPAAGGSDTAGG